METNSIDRGFRIIAAVGFVWLILKRFPGSFAADSEQGVMWAFALLALAFVAVVSLIFFRDETRRLLRHTDLLVPLGLLVSANELLRTLVDLPVTAPLVTVDFKSGIIHWYPVHFGGLLRELYILTSSVAYAGWVMTLIVQLTDEGLLDLWRALKESLRRFWGVLAVLAVGWVVVFTLAQVIRINTEGYMPFAFLLSVSCLCWNVITTPLLPTVVTEGRRPLLRSMADGMRLGWRHWKLWLPPVALQYILLGGVSFFPLGLYSLERMRRIFDGGELSLQWGANGIWTGAFANSFEWYSTALKATGAESELLAYILLSALFSVFAIIVKLHITRKLRGIASFAVVPACEQVTSRK